MNVAGIIEQYNTERPNNVEDYLKCGWLEKCELMIIETVLKTHEGAPDSDELDKHIQEFGMDSELLVKEPYDDLYIYYIDQRVSMNNNDTKRYNMASTLYNNALLVYQQMYTREHMPIRSKNHFINHEG